MTSHVARLYALALSLLVFFVAWAVVAARPWSAAKADPRLTALAAREQRLHRESVAVRRLVDRRWRAYRIALAARRKQIAARNAQIALRQRQIAARQQRLAAVGAQARAGAAAAPVASAAPVRVVTLPPLTITRTS